MTGMEETQTRRGGQNLIVFCVNNLIKVLSVDWGRLQPENDTEVSHEAAGSF